mgnify:CR=1 FL=1
MFQKVFSQLQDDHNSNLHWLPFIIIWCSAYAMSWLSGAAALIFGDIIRDNMNQGFDYPPLWFQYIAIGLIYGLTLAIIQKWAIRRRFNFVPRFFGIATVIGGTLALYSVGMLWDEFYGDPYFELIAGLLWLGVLNVVQALVLFRVNRKAWLVMVAGIVAGLIGGLIFYFEPFSYYSQLVAAFIGTAVQSIATGLIMLWLMAHPREGIVPKRDSSEKAKTTSRQGLHSFTFIAFYACAYLIGWGTLMVMDYLFRATDLNYRLDSLENWIYTHVNWSVGGLWGLVIGIAPIVAQRWLIRQYREVNLSHWRVLTAIGYLIGGIGLYFYVNSYSDTGDVLRYGYLAVWFVAPALLQTISTWRVLRGGWIWVATGIAAAVIAIMIDAQVGNYWESQMLAITFGAIAQAIITGVTYVLLSSQQRNTEKPKAVVEV